MHFFKAKNQRLCKQNKNYAKSYIYKNILFSDSVVTLTTY